ncbi:MAG: hypothetical protein MHM6MM_001289 [Cercozoa sp. M6MM]
MVKDVVNEEVELQSPQIKVVSSENGGWWSSVPYIDLLDVSKYDESTWVGKGLMLFVGSLVRLGRTRSVRIEDCDRMPRGFDTRMIADNFERSLRENTDPDGTVHSARALWQQVRSKVYISAAACIFSSGLKAVQPMIIQELTDYVSVDASDLSKGITLSAYLAASSLVDVLCVNLGFFLSLMCAAQLRVCLQSRLLHKALRLGAHAPPAAEEGDDDEAKKAKAAESSAGQTINLVAADTERIFWFVSFGAMFATTPILLLALMGLMIWTAGWPALVGIGAMIVLFMSQGKFAKQIGAAKSTMLRYTDQRVILLNEALKGMRVVKYYTWEDAVSQRVAELRALEVEQLKKSLDSRAYLGASMFALPLLGSIVILLMMYVRDDKIVLSDAMGILAYTNALTFPSFILPLGASLLMEARVSIGRLNRFFAKPELEHVERIDLDEEEDESITDEDVVVSLKGDWTWPKLSGGTDVPNTSTLKEIDLTLRKGETVAVMGAVGSGKSSLLRALLGEMLPGDAKASRHLWDNTSVAYMAQSPFLRNETLRDNICFDSDFDQERYLRAVYSAALAPDLRQLPASDSTEIGERGINVSGGQKARVSMARAVYAANSSPRVKLVLLDDPLAAVDAHVAHHLSDNVLNRETGALPNDVVAVCVINAHVDALRHFDRVLVLQEGSVAFDGPPRELYADGRFAALLGADEMNESVAGDDEAAESARSMHAEIDSLRDMLFGTPKPPFENDSKARLVQTEQQDSGGVGWPVLRWYTRAMFNKSEVSGGAVWPWVLVMLVLFVAPHGVRTLSDLWLTAWLTKGKLLGVFDADEDKVWIWVWVALAVVSVLLAVFKSLAFVRLVAAASRLVHRTALEKLMHAPSMWLDGQPTGRLLNRFSKDMDAVDVTLSDFALQCLDNSSMLAVSTALILSASVEIFLPVMVVVSIFFLFVQHRARATARDLKRVESMTRSPLLAHFSQSLAGAATLRAFKRRRQTLRRHLVNVDRAARATFANAACQRWLALRLDMAALMVIAMTAFGTALMAHYEKGLSPALAGLALVYAMRFCGLLQWTTRTSVEVESNLTCGQRLRELTMVPQEAARTTPVDPPAEWPQTGAIHFNDLKMRYREDLDLVLKGVQLKIEPGEHVGIVGRTGAGKSSLLQALFRMVENEADGGIEIDGVDCANIGLDKLRRAMAIIPQDPVLFSGTLRFNLDPFNEFDDDEPLWNALEKAHLAHAARQMGGLQVDVGDGGSALSQGQRQLLCVARALLRQTRILLLDEATASVDQETDRLVQETIRENFADRTTLTIAHRLETILDSDRVVVMADGRVEEHGTPAQLLANPDSLLKAMHDAANNNSEKDSASVGADCLIEREHRDHVVLPRSVSTSGTSLAGEDSSPSPIA